MYGGNSLDSSDSFAEASPARLLGVLTGFLRTYCSYPNTLLFSFLVQVRRPSSDNTHVGITSFALARFNRLRSYYRSMAATGTGPSFLESISPWASRSTTPKPTEKSERDAETARLSNQTGADHSISHRHRLSLKDYPSDCPKPHTRWFYAVDVSFGQLSSKSRLFNRCYRLRKESP